MSLEIFVYVAMYHYPHEANTLVGVFDNEELAKGALEQRTPTDARGVVERVQLNAIVD